MAPNLTTFAQRGAIVSIRLRHFMTYDDCTLEKPAPNLNMILGPNGSGKSAIVCAIIVGLAGDVSLTNRAATPAQLVQRGRDWGSTHIELYNDQGKNYVIERKIIITNRSEAKLDHKSEWKLNGKTVLKGEIVRLMAKLNIKVDNLCQFLPQDSVAQFVKMSSCDLLTNTLKAAGDNRLVEQHIKLIEYSDSIRQDKKKLSELQESCRHNVVNARRLETEVGRLREREDMIKKRAICRQKVHYVRFKEAETAVLNSEQELQNMELRLQNAKNNADPFKREVERCKNEEVSLKAAVEEHNRESGQYAARLNRIKEIIEERKLKCQEEFKGFKSKQVQETSREQQVRIKQQELDSLECKLSEIRDVDYTREIAEHEAKHTNVKKDLLQTNHERLKIDNNLRNIVQETEQMRAAREKILAVKERKIQMIASRRPDSHRMIEWLAKNTDKFQKRVLLPMLCEINVKDASHSAYLETVIHESDLYAFVCETEGDLRRLTREARSLKANISVILKPDKAVEEFEYEVSSQQQRMRSKPDAYLKEFIEAPEAVLSYLYGRYGIHQIPVFKEERNQSELKHLLQTCKTFFVGNRFYSVTKSRYDGETLTASDTIRPARNLTFSIDTTSLRNCDTKLRDLHSKKVEQDEKRVVINKQYEDLNKELFELAAHISRLKSKNAAKVQIQTRIDLCRQTISSLQNERIDIEKEKTKLKQNVSKINHDMTNDLAKMAKTCQDYVRTRKKLFLESLMCHLAGRNYALAYKRHKAAMNEANQLVDCIRDQKQQISSLGKQAERLRLYAEEKIEGFTNNHLGKRTKKNFLSIEQNTVEALEQFIEELKVKIRNISEDQDNSIIREFNRENEELREKQMTINELESDVQHKEMAMNEIKQDWLPKLNDVLKVIDEHYQDFMRKLNYAGKVELDHDVSSPDDFKSYGIKIMVKYRDNEQLIPLSSTRQSGGERSVATMIYMLALQTKTTVPFRVVDEINQGMDKDNERKVFELLVRTAEESSSQYFLVSPKLLSGLNYGNKMQIHVVFNGKNMDYSWSSLFGNSSDTGIYSDEE